MLPSPLSLKNLSVICYFTGFVSGPAALRDCVHCGGISWPFLNLLWPAECWCGVPFCSSLCGGQPCQSSPAQHVTVFPGAFPASPMRSQHSRMILILTSVRQNVTVYILVSFCLLPPSLNISFFFFFLL